MIELNKQDIELMQKNVADENIIIIITSLIYTLSLISLNTKFCRADYIHIYTHNCG